MKVDDVIGNMREQGLTATRVPVATSEVTTYETTDTNEDSLCGIAVSRGEQKATAVWYDDGYNPTLFVISDDPVFRQTVSDCFFLDDEDDEE